MHILLIEDDRTIAGELEARWRAKGWAVDACATLLGGSRAAAHWAPDVIVLDLNLPDGDGLEWLAAFRQGDPHTPVIALTARDRVTDRVEGLRRGADDYLVKPFSAEELDARIEALQRRSGSARGERVEFGRLLWLRDERQAFVAGAPLELHPREFEVLGLLLRRAPRLVARRFIVQVLAERNVELGESAVDVYISRLRRKLAGSGAAIATVRGFGYRLEPDAGAAATPPEAGVKRVADRWLQRDLLHRVLLPVLAIVLVASAATAIGAHEVVEDVFDRWLLDAAHSLAAQVRFDGPRASVQLAPQAEAMLRYDVVDRVSYEVLQGGSHLSGDMDLPLQGDDEDQFPAGERAYDTTLRGRPVRVAAVRVPGPGAATYVVVAETQAKRDEATRALLLVLAPVAALVLLAAIAVALAVRRTLQPLERMAALWKGRSHGSLDPVPTQDVPRELLPFALALNELLARVRELVVRERHFASTAAHQLRTPLAGLQLAIARAAQCPDLESTRQALAGLENATQQAARLLQQLLSLARLDPEGRGSIELAPVDLVALAREVGEVYVDAAMERDIGLELAPARRDVVVPGQADLLREALGNLIDNAIRYTPPGGRVELAIADDPPSISVRDSGPGIRPEERGRVFERFVRGEGTVGSGSGLGLAIVREIAALHGAEVQLDPAVAGGARFVLRFPAPAQAAA